MVTKLLDKLLSLGGLMKGNKRLSGVSLIVVSYLLELLKAKFGIAIELPWLQEAGMGLMAVGVAHADVKDKLSR